MVRTSGASHDSGIMRDAHGAERLWALIDHLGRTISVARRDNRGFHAQVAAPLVLLDRASIKISRPGMSLVDGVRLHTKDGLPAVGRVWPKVTRWLAVLDQHVSARWSCRHTRAHLQ